MATVEQPLLGVRALRNGSEQELLEAVRRAPLRGDPTILPYETSKIEIVAVGLDRLSPLAYYVLRRQLTFANTLRASLIAADNVDPWSLWSLVEFELAGETRRVSPPVVEVMYESNNGGGLSRHLGIVDGLHRCYAAREAGLSTMVVVVVHNPRYPLACLPLTWADVRVVDEVPDGKRRYRYATAEALRAAHPDLAAKVTPENHQYFLYRDLSHLGSSGIR